MGELLEPGDEISCPQCGRWHGIAHWHTVGTDYTVRMLYFECRGGPLLRRPSGNRQPTQDPVAHSPLGSRTSLGRNRALYSIDRHPATKYPKYS